MKSNKIISIILICSIIIISSSIFSWRNSKQAQSTNVESEANKKQEEILKNLNRELSDEQWIEDIEEITKIVSHENFQWIKSILPRYISVPEILYGLNIIEDLVEIQFPQA